jgi:hypothetical protein
MCRVKRHIKAASFDKLRMTTVALCYAMGVQFCVSKKIIKGMQVDTLVPQATKDAPSCEKRRGAAKKR